jgi:hypothetical protein
LTNQRATDQIVRPAPSTFYRKGLATLAYGMVIGMRRVLHVALRHCQERLKMLG